MQFIFQPYFPSCRVDYSFQNFSFHISRIWLSVIIKSIKALRVYQRKILLTIIFKITRVDALHSTRIVVKKFSVIRKRSYRRVADRHPDTTILRQVPVPESIIAYK